MRLLLLLLLLCCYSSAMIEKKEIFEIFYCDEDIERQATPPPVIMARYKAPGFLDKKSRVVITVDRHGNRVVKKLAFYPDTGKAKKMKEMTQSSAS